MNCTCDFGSYADDYAPRVFSSEVRTARKRHRCCECGEPILPGTRYEYIRGLWEGEWDSFHTCLACAAIRDEYMCGHSFGELVDEIKECFGFDYREVPDVEDESREG